MSDEITVNDYMADRMDKAAESWVDMHEENWGKNSGEYDQSMVDLGYDDAKDLRNIGQLLREGRKTEARHTANSLDTAVRDEIPSSVWDYLMDQFEGELK